MAATNTYRELLWPGVFVAAMAYVTWNFPKFILALGLANDAITATYTAAGTPEYVAALLAMAAFVLGVLTVHTSELEHAADGFFDRLSLFLGRVAMLLIALLVSVMFYEVVVRYVFEKPTLWANELSLWMAGFIFLLAGLYAMQQRSHIRIYLLYDVMPRWAQKLADSVSVLLIWAFTISMIWGGYNEARDKILRWETFGTAFDPPIPATMKSMVLIVILLVSIQALSNLIADWRKVPEHHGVVDEDEIETLKHDLDVSGPDDDRGRGA